MGTALQAGIENEGPDAQLLLPVLTPDINRSPHAWVVRIELDR